MSEDNKPAETPDSQPETQHAEKPHAIAADKTASSNTSFILLTFLIMLGACGGLFYVWQALQQANIHTQLNKQQFNQQLSDLEQKNSDTNQLLQTELNTLQASHDNLRNNLTNLIKDNDHLRNDWLMAEAEYLIQLANYRVLLEKDVVTAAIALKAADARLAEVADPALLGIRKILAKDIQALNNVPRVDIAGLSVTLSALNSNIKNLPLLTPDPESHKNAQKDNPTESSQVENVSDLPAAIWQDIKKLIVIRNHQKPVEALLPPKQHFFLTQNLALLLEQTRLALLNGQNDIYHERLSTTIKWVRQFFDTSHNVTRNMLASLEELTKYDIDPALPEISSTFSAIQKYRLQGKSETGQDTKPSKKLKPTSSTKSTAKPAPGAKTKPQPVAAEKPVVKSQSKNGAVK